MITPDANTMSIKLIPLQLLLLSFSLPALGQVPPGTSETELRQPLNLSLPREATPPLSTPLSGSKESSVVESNLRQEKASSGRNEGHFPYGTGYEARQRGGLSGGGMGRGGVGRVGMGRGR